MQRVQFSENLLSFFGASQRIQAPNNESFTRFSLVKSLIGAFFAVLAVSLILNIVVKNFSKTGNLTAASSIEEKVAYEPGQFVSNELKGGYLGYYR